MSGATWTDLRGGPRVGDLVADPVYPIELESDVVLRGAAAAALDQDYVHHLTLLAFSGGDEGKVVGGAQYVAIDEHRAEVSFSVADRLQGRGLGSLLLAEDYPSAPWFESHTLRFWRCQEHLVASKERPPRGALSSLRTIQVRLLPRRYPSRRGIPQLLQSAASSRPFPVSRPIRLAQYSP
jgi:GNAT superfamily N-acetyltransferase